MRAKLLLASALALVAVGCQEATKSDEAKKGTGEVKQPEGGVATMNVTSTAFKAGERIPQKYTGEGADVSPPLAWGGAPEGTKQLALICDDPDAPTPKPWVHWVAYGIPADCTSLAEGNAGAALEGKNNFGRTSYGGPMPPPGHGVHHYRFKLYALDAPLALEAGATKEQLLAAMKGHIIGEGELVGTYERK